MSLNARIEPYQDGDGILMMPMKNNIPSPADETWSLKNCPTCGQECWETGYARKILLQKPYMQCLCTMCALEAGIETGGG